MPPNPSADLTWRQAVSVYLQPRVIVMIFLGFSSGLPFLLVFSTLTVWLTESGVSRSAIGFFAWVGITYSIKVLWAPIVDRIRLPFLSRWLGQRRSWILLGQTGIGLGLAGMAISDPESGLLLISLCALLVAFSSATQDVAIDAYRIEVAAVEFQGAMSAAYVFGWRFAALIAGAGALLIAEYIDWRTSYLIMGGLMLVGVVTILLAPEPENNQQGLNLSYEREQRVLDFLVSSQGQNEQLRRIQAWFIGAVICPFVDFFSRNGRFALVILLFISVFRLSDITMGIMANPFYLDMGYTKAEIASIAKVFGFFMTMTGAAICGVLVVKWGVLRPLLIGAIAVAATNLLFALLSTLPADILWLGIVISADNISGGFAATAFIAYLSGLTNRAYTATQYALFSSLMTLPGKFISGFSGLVVDGFGYLPFFLFAAAVGIPAILLVLVLMRRPPVREPTETVPG